MHCYEVYGLRIMGQEIDQAEFNPADFERFQRRLTSEMALLRELFISDSFN